jgi:adenosine deaminase
MRALRLLSAVFFAASVATAQGTEERTSRHMEAIRQKPAELLPFLRRMPKGADLHSHLGGAVYAESLIAWAAEDRLCVDRASSALTQGACGTCEASEKTPAAACALKDQALHDQLVDAWSMRNWERRDASGHDHFFATFDRFSAAFRGRVGDALAEVASRAASEGLLHLELMHSASDGTIFEVAGRVGWDDDFVRLREKLLADGMDAVVAAVRARLDRVEARRDELLGCGGARAAAGCAVSTRFLYQVLRGLPRELVFAQIVLAFELTKVDPRFAGFNLVMPEDWHTPMRDFDLHIRMIETLRPLYPGARIALHAGELAMGLVPPEGLRHHIRSSVMRAGAERIGHGVSVMHEDDPTGLMKEMARRGVLVEVCLTSNDVILGVRAARHPLATYRKHGVPVALATDDQGVARSDMTHEYLRAVQDQGLSYRDLKTMARRSLTHSFLRGPSLWASSGAAKVADCRRDDPGKPRTSASCSSFLSKSERARLQWRLEQAFVSFEKEF